MAMEDISWKQAIKIIAEKADEVKSRLESEEVDIKHACMRISSRKVFSPVSLPPFKRAMVDGFALRARDTLSASKYSPAKLKIVARIDAGEKHGIKIGEDEACKVNTGAMLPENADAVVKIEECEEKESHVYVFSPVPKWKNVAEEGEDVKKGMAILEEFQKILPQDIALLAACGIRKVEVLRKLKASIIATGSELVEPGEKLGHGKIYDANSYLISSYLAMVNCEVHEHGIIEDAPEKIEEEIKKASGDFLIISGATSKGEKDFVPEIVKKLGKIYFKGVRIRPGHPFSFGEIENKPVFLLPGFPVACFVSLEIFVRQFILRAYRQRMENRKRVRAILRQRIPSKLGFAEFARLKVFREGDKFFAEKVATKGAGVITTLTEANAYAIIPENLEGIEEGEEIEAFLLRENEIS